MEFTKKQIINYMDKYIKNYLVDAEWHINLATDFLHLLNDEKIELIKLSDQRYVKSVLENNPDNEYTKKVNMRSTPEVYISALFQMLIEKINIANQTQNIYSVKVKERSTGRILELNPCIDNPFSDTMTRGLLHSGEYILISGNLPDKWKDSTEVDEATAKEGSHEVLQSIQTEISNLQHHLQNLQGNLDNTYYKMLQECMIEASDNTQKIYTQKNEMLSLYHLLESDYTKRMTWVKNKLPWYMSVFHKLSSSEIFLDQTNIFIGVSFGKQIETKCYVRITPKDIGWKNCEVRTDRS